MIGGMVKGFNLTLDYVLYEMSYQNMVMYSSVLPSYKSTKDKKQNKEDDDVINADDPANREKIHEMLFAN